MADDLEQKATQLARALLESVGLTPSPHGPLAEPAPASPPRPPRKSSPDGKKPRASAPRRRTPLITVSAAFAPITPPPRAENAARFADVLKETGLPEAELRRQVREYLAEQFGASAIDLGAAQRPADDVLRLLPPDLARTFGLLPLRLAGEALVVATDDPSNRMVLHALGAATGRRVEAVVTSQPELDEAIDRFYGA